MWVGTVCSKIIADSFTDMKKEKTIDTLINALKHLLGKLDGTLLTGSSSANHDTMTIYFLQWALQFFLFRCSQTVFSDWTKVQLLLTEYYRIPYNSVVTFQK